MSSVLVLLVFLSPLVSATSRMPVDLPPDASAAQLKRILEQQGQFHLFREGVIPLGPVEAAILLGERNLSWLKLINKNRAVPISFSSQATTGGISIDKPHKYSPAIILEWKEELKRDLPERMRQTLFEGGVLSAEVPTSEDEYIKWGRKVDRLYQAALRWKTLEPWRDHYEQNRSADIRGIYFFGRMDYKTRQQKLASAKDWTEQEQRDLSDWLVSMCLNNFGDVAFCRGQVREAVVSGESLMPLYGMWEMSAQITFDEKFSVQKSRSDVRFQADHVLHVPFRDPLDEAVREFLRHNVEDEWKFGEWALKLIFGPDAAAHIRFEAGVTPHVNGLGGDRITMNADQPLSEYDAQWAIRHEFGHVLGFPDCYVEFYDSEAEAMVTYQIDVTNLMCSRHGRLQERHVNELRRVYRR